RNESERGLGGGAPGAGGRRRDGRSPLSPARRRGARRPLPHPLGTRRPPPHPGAGGTPARRCGSRGARTLLGGLPPGELHGRSVGGHVLPQAGLPPRGARGRRLPGRGASAHRVHGPPPPGLKADEGRSGPSSPRSTFFSAPGELAGCRPLLLLGAAAGLVPLLVGRRHVLLLL